MADVFYALFFFLLFLGQSNSQAGVQEQSVLLRLKQFWGNPAFLEPWSTQSTNVSHCSWPYVKCTNNSVTELSLANQNITGTIPPFICELSGLTKLDLSFNYIPGGFPTALYNCSKLQYLDLSQNYFVGAIPDSINRLSGLQFLSLAANNFSGDIPATIGMLTELSNLQIHQNQLNGTFPPEIGNLSNLEILYLSYNRKLVPTRLHSSFTQLKKLKVLWMSEANLIGEIPDSIGNMTALETLDISTNSLSGKIPSGLFSLKNLNQLYLFKNKLSGEIPPVVGALNLTVIDLSQNNLTGRIPEDFGKLQKLVKLNLIFNQMSGEVPESISHLPALTILRLFNNNFSGPLPPDFGRYSLLEEFQVSSNKFSGKLPEHLCDGGALVGVVAFDNNLTGELPISLGNCNSLLMVSVYNNKLSGNIPDGLWTSLNLSILMLSNNSFTGQLPVRLSGNLSRIEIDDNRFSGNIPDGVSSWENLVVFKASNNFLTGKIPRGLTYLLHLSTLLLDRNQLSGELPSDLYGWNSLIILNLSQNQLSGQIPEQLGYLSGISELDLSRNQFSGPVPPQLGILRLTVLNLSSNSLVGPIPFMFENRAYADSFLDNPGLCASTPSMNLSICNANQSERSNALSPQFLAMIISVAAALFVLAMLFSFFVFTLYWKRKLGMDSNWKLTSFQRLSFTESNILSGLTESNLIGSGGSGKVYRVALNHSGGVVAVKKIWNNRRIDQKLEKEFAAEVKTLSTLRHSNIVKLLCCMSSENSKLLVYEYLENRSLDRWLQKKNRPSVNGSGTVVHHVILDWPTRLRIAVGAAQGLCYMHHDCFPSIIHRDVKSSNILLDSDFNAKIADFGLAKMLIKLGEPHTMSAVAGSFGYIAPECAHTQRVNEKVDVYSFGVVLLELATGKEANEGDENKCLAEWAWRHLQDGKPIADALDEEVKEGCYLEEMSTMFKVGIICTGTLPSSRPSMKEALQILRRSNHAYGSGLKKALVENDTAPLFGNSRRERRLESDSESSESEV